jgi:O-antigen ligase
VAQGALLAFGIVLLQMSHSATSVACFILGGALMLLTTRRAIRNRPGRVYALCLAIVLAGGLFMLFGGGSLVSSALGRGEGLSGRTEIWAAGIAAVGSPVIGTGFESFWISPNAEKVRHRLLVLGWWEPEGLNEAHNGYLEVYLNLGWIGVFLIILILINSYRCAGNAFRRDPEFGGLMLAYIATGTFYSLTEAGFRTLSPSWFFLLLAVVSASGVAAGLFGGDLRDPIGSRGGIAISKPSSNKLIPATATVYSARRGLARFEVTRRHNLC